VPRSLSASETLAGFTLFELLVVLTIVALASTVIIPSLVGRTGLEAKRVARELAAGLRQARGQAIVRNQTTSLALNVDERRFNVAGDPRTRQLHKGVTLALYTARSELLGAQAGNIRFFPDGSSTGGRITVSGGKQTYLVDVDWLTGRVRVANGSLDQADR
jgi:general secretion pathway protein H